MCGISGGVWLSERRSISAKQLDLMTDSLSHRGPDGRGTFRRTYLDGRGVALGHRRLSIIDIEGGGQPLHNESGSIWIVFNGEIYNYLELQESLKRLGHQFSTRSDTETIVHLYEEYGTACLEYLRGMFAFAIWDEEKKRLFFARDRLGQKPFVYSNDSERFIFGSEIKSLFALNSVPKGLREESIAEYLLYGYIPAPNTGFRGVFKLQPAHYGVYENGVLKIDRYWNPCLQPDISMSLRESEEMMRSRLRDAIRTQLRSDVPLGCFLSGGIDSTVIAGEAQSQLETSLNTFTIGFKVEDYDESKFAEAVAVHLGTSHRCLEVKPESVNILERLVGLFDEPFADSSAIPTYFLCEETSKYVKVALSGDGGDELFAGYGRHLTSDRLGFFDHLPKIIKRILTGRWVDLLPRENRRSILGKVKNRLTVLRGDFPSRYVDWVSPFSFQDVRKLIDDTGRRGGAAIAGSYLENIIRGFPEMCDGSKAMRADMLTYLPGDLLPKVDIVSMAHGLECRSPFLDHLLIEDAMRIPFHLLTSLKYTKPMLSRTFQTWFPKGLESRPKMGFRVPLSFWFRGQADCNMSSLLDKDSFCGDHVNLSYVSHLLELNREGRWDYGDRIWALQFLEAWGRTNF